MMAPNGTVVPSSQSSQGMDVEKRFAHLLNPIRDLARNWETDLASDLEEYLGQLETITITFNGGQTTMNFAQAALLIQGSTCVYSKKVEYLYTLVMQMLELLHNKRKANANVDANGNDKDCDSLMKKDEEYDFLDLDDLKSSAGIGLKDDDANKGVLWTKNASTLLIPLDDSEKKDDRELIAGDNTVVGNRKDFKAWSIALAEDQVLQIGSTVGGLDTTGMFASHKLMTSDLGRASQLLQPTGEANLQSAQDDGVADFDDPFEDSKAGDEERLAGEERKEIPDEKAIVPPAAREGLRPRKVGLKVSKAAEERKMRIEQCLLDVNEVKPGSVKPRKKIVCRKKNKIRIPAKLQSITEHIARTLTDRSHQLPKAILAPSESAFTELALEEMERRKNWMKEDAKLGVNGYRNRPLNETEIMDLLAGGEENGEDGEDSEAAAPNNGADANGNDDFDAGDPADDDFDLGEYRPNDYARPDLQGDGDKDETANFDDTLSYEKLAKRHLDNYLANCQAYVQTSELHKRVEEWEKKIHPKLDEVEHRTTFDIHTYGGRVLACFRDSVTSVSNAPGPTKDQNPKQFLSFRRIGNNQMIYETTRLFAATLQLANSKNILIESKPVKCKDDLSTSINTMQVGLLSRQRHHEALNDYVAPSLQVNGDAPRDAAPPYVRPASADDPSSDGSSSDGVFKRPRMTSQGVRVKRTKKQVEESKKRRSITFSSDEEDDD